MVFFVFRSKSLDILYTSRKVQPIHSRYQQTITIQYSKHVSLMFVCTITFETKNDWMGITMLQSQNYKRTTFSHATRNTNYEKLSIKTTHTHNDVINFKI